ncbi:MAG TPA: hypothetical protein DDZ90_34505 [Planctomycetaceae bacterium]|nr:hypothetical protein [Planctomycetaceae bacterium]|tara:strand:+ start:718 stop:1293 length:576 start_codon:yes stop_codon:yes gene_type:complete
MGFSGKGNVHTRARKQTSTNVLSFVANLYLNSLNKLKNDWVKAMRRPKPIKPIMPLMMGAIYRKTDAQDLLGIGRDLMTALKRKGLIEVRRIGGKDYVKSDDVWNAMQSVNSMSGKETPMLTGSESVFTEAEAAAYLRIKPRTLAEERLRGRITPFRIVGNRIRYTEEMLIRYLQNHPLNEKQSSDGGPNE